MNLHARFAAERSADATATRRLRIRVRGLVQGVGFRPHVWRLARRNGLTGYTLNDADGVLIEVQGNLDTFVADLVAEAPPLARIDAATAEERDLVAGENDFVIRDSERGGPARTAITPTSRSATLVLPKCSIRRTAAIFIRSSPARIAARALR